MGKKIKQKIPDNSEIEHARNNFTDFIKLQREFRMSGFHDSYYKVLHEFAAGKIKKLIVTMPPQHGKSSGAAVLLPAYLLGVDPDLKIVIASYGFKLASRYNRYVQRIIDSTSYRAVFPETSLKDSGTGGRNYLRTAEEFEIVGRDGGMLAVGRGGPLTGNMVDVIIMDDLYKNSSEANSPVIRNNIWDWYISVVKTRLHDNSRELMVMTRWHDEDIIGEIKRREPILPVWQLAVDEIGGNCWYELNFEALKESTPNIYDERSIGEPLWPERHGVESLLNRRRLEPYIFETMYQGKPVAAGGLLYGDRFRTYLKIPEDIIKKGNYTDTADTGTDYLCSVCYEIDKENNIYVSDIVYTCEGMEITEETVAAMLDNNKTRTAYIESNNEGRGFARNIDKKVSLTKIEWFYQKGNKESRIITNSATVLKHILMPEDWHLRWNAFYMDVIRYKRDFKLNRTHDAADVLTGIVEKEVVGKVDNTLKAAWFG
ncbi:MAG: phage terminase large subunit [Rikenellaceae bacterium]|nr:phage terminase large subunit [Rikenellaceae bacterium]